MNGLVKHDLKGKLFVSKPCHYFYQSIYQDTFEKLPSNDSNEENVGEKASKLHCSFLKCFFPLDTSKKNFSQRLHSFKRSA